MEAGVQHQVSVTVLMGLGVAKQHPTGELQYSPCGCSGFKGQADSYHASISFHRKA
jgi:hypothetical protein